MFKTLKKLPACIVLASLSLQVVPAWADPHDDHDRHERREMGRESRDDRFDNRRDERHDDHRDERRGDRDDDRDERRGPPRMGGYFAERDRLAVYEYYGQPRAKCPPGLAKKGDRCQPPGQARYWRMGQPLPRDVRRRPVEADVRIQLGTPPAGYEFVRVAGDILLIAVGTAMVIDAIQDIQGR
jgi:Ni/Co efflux regulator RcnB